ncbi:MAG: hypothetical protein HYZ48_04240 [Chlamydiales bacterium]|nr:hypothetical protein [Chlamydiales bacterium]
MNRSQFKKIVGLGVLTVGAGIVITAIYLLQRTYEGKQNASSIASPSASKPLEAIIGRLLHHKIGENDLQHAGLLVGGMIVLLGGSAVVLIFRDKN